MAFNLAQYNLNPFNVAGGNVRWIKAHGSEYITTSIGSALQIYAQAYGNERIREESNGVSTKYIRAAGSETVAETVTKGQNSILLYLRFAEVVNEETTIAAIIMPTATGEEIVEAETSLGSNSYLTVDFAEAVNADVSLGSDIYLTASGFELVSESASLEIIDTKICYLTTELKPGERIVIDADTYTVLLNSENAIEIQSGDWIDELDRSTTDIAIKAASGVAYLSAHIIYTERYL